MTLIRIRAKQEVTVIHTNTLITCLSTPPSESRYWNFSSFLLMTAKHQCISL
ncbi:hypothetical protein HanIR_Chr17g0853061 [Helianthus annuus]|nr:hypothetical protein HanIR_Chr17g0853061 [Helianthus annuus]